MGNESFTTANGNICTKKRRYWAYTPEEMQEIVNDYHRGLTYNELRLKYGVASATVCQMLSEVMPTVPSVRKRQWVRGAIKVEDNCRLPARKKYWSDEEKQAIVYDWYNGLTYAQIKEKYGCSNGVIHTAKKKFAHIIEAENTQSLTSDNTDSLDVVDEIKKISAMLVSAAKGLETVADALNKQNRTSQQKNSLQELFKLLSDVVA